jgi:hypothetical protein
MLPNNPVGPMESGLRMHPTPVVLQVPVLPPQHALMQDVFFVSVTTSDRHCVSNTDKHFPARPKQPGGMILRPNARLWRSIGDIVAEASPRIHARMRDMLSLRSNIRR